MSLKKGFLVRLTKKAAKANGFEKQFYGRVISNGSYYCTEKFYKVKFQSGYVIGLREDDLEIVRKTKGPIKMSRKIKIGKKEIKVRNPIASALSLGQFKPKVVKDKRKYNRKKLKKPVTEE